jgi:hypothetical protein
MGDSYAYSSHHWIFYREHNTSLKGAHDVSPPVNNTTRIHTIFLRYTTLLGGIFVFHTPTKKMYQPLFYCTDDICFFNK